MKRILFPVVLTGILLAGCQPEGGIEINSVNGTVPMSATIKATSDCTNTVLTTDSQAKTEISGTTLTIHLYSFPSTGATCTGTAKLVFDTEIKVTDEGEKSVLWNGTAPMKADGSGQLPTTINATKTKTTVTVEKDYDLADGFPTSSDLGKSFYNVSFIDDSTNNIVIYNGDSKAGVDSNQFPNFLTTTGSTI